MENGRSLFEQAIQDRELVQVTISVTKHSIIKTLEYFLKQCLFYCNTYTTKMGRLRGGQQRSGPFESGEA
ncbi:hypothetical protein C1T20_18710 [Paenibacillus polymyxa]|nr:hypothetical protein C1T20_18710 [Paenibacillus polymyxa]